MNKRIMDGLNAIAKAELGASRPVRKRRTPRLVHYVCRDCGARCTKDAGFDILGRCPPCYRVEVYRRGAALALAEKK